MRISIDIDETQIRSLDRLASRDGCSRADIIRKAITEYLGRRAPQALDDAFGFWGERKVDGLSYQEKVRSEW
jgi:metal-responsive CopG/Arc/MetJ family transcriptional regulator